MVSAHGFFRSFVALFGRGGRLLGALGVNRARRLIGYRRMIGDGASWADTVAEAGAAG